MPNPKNTTKSENTATSNYSSLKAFLIYCLLLSLWVPVEANKAEKIKVAKAKLGDALEPCKNYLTASSVCMLQNMKFTLEGEQDNACDKLPGLLELISEDKRDVCKEMLPQPNQIHTEVSVGAQIRATNRPDIHVKNTKTVRKSFSFAEKMKNPEDARNCEKYVSHRRACEDSKGSKTDSCEQYPGFFEKISKGAQATCVEMSNILDKTFKETKEGLKEYVDDTVKPNRFEL